MKIEFQEFLGVEKLHWESIRIKMMFFAQTLKSPSILLNFFTLVLCLSILCFLNNLT
jgi:hypothetical protein